MLFLFLPAGQVMVGAFKGNDGGVTLSQLDATTQLFIRSLNGIRQDQALVRPAPTSNPMLWVAGHLVQ